ncbi:MAG TPA: D-2-hydroxyacid dehydrogenase [Candidatus Acidoferrales bacterium]|nr:D-2-hydroxyacid dehydrogenase [Candidatus Acidoferrales bacterium]
MKARRTAAAILATFAVATAAGQSAKKKIVVAGVGQAMVEQLRTVAPAGVEIVGAAPTQVAAEIADADALISGQITRQQLAAAKQLKWVQILNAGAEDYIPILKGTDVTLTNLKVVLGPEVADHAMALLLALTRGLYETIPARKWEVPRDIGRVTELQGKTAVIVGVGGVGMQIAQRAAAFGMTVLGVDPKDAAPPTVSKMMKPDQLDSVLSGADVLFVTVPETPATKGMIGAKQFGELKRGAFFICVSRGTIYSTDALVDALTNRRLAGAGLDVTDPEPLPSNHPLWKFENVLITPHIAGASDAASERVIDLLEENIRLFAAGQPLRNVVDKEKGY